MAAEQYFYHSAAESDQPVERALARIESAFRGAFLKLNEARNLAHLMPEDKAILAEFVAAQQLRTCPELRCAPMPWMDEPDQTRPIRVLVVDDEPSICTLVERALRQAGYDVAVASDGYAALRVVEAQDRFDLFVIDLVMPDMRGDELARRLRQRDTDVKILYFTGYGDHLENGTMLWHRDAVLEKPATMKELTEAVSLRLFGHLRGLNA